MKRGRLFICVDLYVSKLFLEGNIRSLYIDWFWGRIAGGWGYKTKEDVYIIFFCFFEY